MKRYLIHLTFVVLVCSLVSTTASPFIYAAKKSTSLQTFRFSKRAELASTQTYLDISDTAFKACINKHLNQADTAQVTAQQALSITSLDCSGKGIRSLRGIEAFKNIESLNLEHNNIVSVARLTTLSNIKDLILGNNNIEHVNPLAALTSLEILYINNNHIKDISALSPLTHTLTVFNISDNPIKDISALKNIKTLRVFYGNNTRIKDISALRYSMGLSKVEIRNANLSSIEPLYHHHILHLDFSGNHITDFSYPFLSVYILRFGTFEIENQSVNLGTISQETKPFLLGSQGYPFSIKNIIGDAHLDEYGTLHFTSVGEHKIEYYTSDDKLVGTLTATTKDRPIFKDRNLKACVNSKLGQESNTYITKEQALSLTSLDCSNKNITSLQGLEMFTNLKSINLSHNTISDIQPLVSIVGLTSLTLSNNPINHVDGTLWLLKNLEFLEINNARIQYINDVSYLPSLSTLSLSNNQIRYISGFDSTKLTSLALDGNQILDFNELKTVAPTIKNLNIKNQNLTFKGNSFYSYLRNPNGEAFTIKNIKGSASIDMKGIVTFNINEPTIIEFYDGTEHIGTITGTP